MLDVLVNIDGAIVEGNLLIIKDRSVAYRIALSIITTLALDDEKVQEEKDERPVWPGRK